MAAEKRKEGNGKIIFSLRVRGQAETIGNRQLLYKERARRSMTKGKEREVLTKQSAVIGLKKGQKGKGESLRLSDQARFSKKDILKLISNKKGNAPQHLLLGGKKRRAQGSALRHQRAVRTKRLWKN